MDTTRHRPATEPEALDLTTANRLLAEARRLARERGLPPLTACVLDRHGHIVSAQSEDGSALLHFDIAFAKAWGCVGLGHSSRHYKDVLLRQSPQLAGGLEALARGRVVAEYGGVLVRDAAGLLVGAVGVAGVEETAAERLAVDGITACGLQADLG